MKKTLKWITIILLTILVLIMLAGMYKFNYLASKEGYDCDGNKIEKSIDISTK
jgi:anionic cell wall polymer biosynthesis LytR-Cps2A-Psr (LCP) family protein